MSNKFSILRFKELYKKDKTATILLEVEKQNNILTNLEYTKELKDVFIIDLETDIFKNSEIDKLISLIYTEIVDKNLKAKDRIINKDVWNKYLIFKEEKDKIYNEFGAITTTHYEKPSFNEASNAYNDNNIKYRFEFPKIEDYEELYVDSETTNDCYKVRICEFGVKNNEEYAFHLLHIIFNSAFDLKIKLCENCKKPFLTKTLNTKNCLRKNEKGLTCIYEKIKIQKQHQNDDPIKHLIKNVRDLYENKPDEKEKFIEELDKKKTEYFNNNKDFVLWLLSHYKTKEKRLEVIKRLELSTYL